MFASVFWSECAFIYSAGDTPTYGVPVVICWFGCKIEFTIVSRVRTHRRFRRRQAAACGLRTDRGSARIQDTLPGPSPSAKSRPLCMKIRIFVRKWGVAVRWYAQLVKRFVAIARNFPDKFVMNVNLCVVFNFSAQEGISRKTCWFANTFGIWCCFGISLLFVTLLYWFAETATSLR